MNTFKMLRLFAMMVLAAVVMVGCSASGPQPVETKTDGGAAMQAKQAIKDAEAAVAKAASVNGEWRDTGKLMKQAVNAGHSGDNELAIKLANEVRAEAEMGYCQAILERAKPLIKQLAEHESSMNDDQMARYAAAKAAVADYDCDRAYALASNLLAEMQAMPADTSIAYSVQGGDSLWSISGQSGIYGNPYQWPLIYKANSDQINDADLIFPGQNFSIDTAPSQGDIDAAVDHARNRGAWSVGPVEASDRAYLGQ